MPEERHSNEGEATAKLPTCSLWCKITSFVWVCNPILLIYFWFWQLFHRLFLFVSPVSAAKQKNKIKKSLYYNSKARFSLVIFSRFCLFSSFNWGRGTQVQNLLCCCRFCQVSAKSGSAAESVTITDRWSSWPFARRRAAKVEFENGTSAARSTFTWFCTRWVVLEKEGWGVLTSRNLMRLGCSGGKIWSAFFFSQPQHSHNEWSVRGEGGRGGGENSATRIEKRKRATSDLLTAPISGLMAADNGCNEDEPFYWAWIIIILFFIYIHTYFNQWQLG